MNSQAEYNNYVSLLDGYAADISSIRRNLRGKISGYDQIGKRLNQVCQQVDTCSSVMNVMGEKAYVIGKQYKTTELTIQGKERQRPNLRDAHTGAHHQAPSGNTSNVDWLEVIDGIVDFLDNSSEIMDIDVPWLGIIGDILTVLDNYQDYSAGEMGFERFIAEAANEVLIGYGLNLCAAAIAGPAGVAVLWGISILYETFTGNDLVETLSDAWLDFSDWVGNKAKQVTDAVCSWWSDLWSFA